MVIGYLCLIPDLKENTYALVGVETGISPLKNNAAYMES